MRPGKNQFEIIRKMIGTKEDKFCEYCPRLSGFHQKEATLCEKLKKIDV